MPNNKRLQLTLQPSRRLPFFRVGAYSVAVARHELIALDQLRRSLLTTQLKR